MTISEIYIENIRGFQSQSLTVDIRPNTTNIVVAPNGFGKSSISTAFHCATGTTLTVSDEDKHRKQTTSPSILRLTINGTQYTADAAQNQISQTAKILVIKSATQPKAKVPRINGIVIPRPYLEIPDIDLGTVAQKCVLHYDPAQAKQKYQNNTKVAQNVTKVLGKPLIQQKLLNALPELDKLKQAKRSALLQKVIDRIAVEQGTRETILKSIELQLRTELEADEVIKAICEQLQSSISGLDWTSSVLLAIEISALIETDRANFKKWLQRGAFEGWLERTRSLISVVNSCWVAAEIKEVKDRVKLIFPPAQQLSNGQRDLLYLASSLLKLMSIRPTETVIVLIDEVFDYLDDANLAVAQYFLSTIVENFRAAQGRIYPLLMTHLDPAVFKGYALRKRNVIYLGLPNQAITNTMKTIILKREDALWKDDLEKYFLHFHPDERDLSALFNQSFQLPLKHGNSKQFYQFLAGEWSKLEADRDDYDPFAVCAHLRIQIERMAYELLGTKEQRDSFLETHGTKNKLDLVSEYGFQVPEIWTLLGVVYNEAMHLKTALDQKSTISLKLRNLGLRRMIGQALAN